MTKVVRPRFGRPVLCVSPPPIPYTNLNITFGLSPKSTVSGWVKPAADEIVTTPQNTCAHSPQRRTNIHRQKNHAGMLAILAILTGNVTSDATYAIYVGHGGKALQICIFLAPVVCVVVVVLRSSISAAQEIPRTRFRSLIGTQCFVAARMKRSHMRHTTHTQGWAIKRVYGNAARGRCVAAYPTTQQRPAAIRKSTGTTHVYATHVLLFDVYTDKTKKERDDLKNRSPYRMR